MIYIINHLLKYITIGMGSYEAKWSSKNVVGVCDNSNDFQNSLSLSLYIYIYIYIYYKSAGRH